MDYIKNINLVLADNKNKLSGVSKARLEQIRTSLKAHDGVNKMLERRNMLMARGEAIKKRACTFNCKRYLPEESKNIGTSVYEEVNEEGYFIQFGEEAEESSVSGFGNFTVAIVEGQDGQVYTINPNNLKFKK